MLLGICRRQRESVADGEVPAVAGALDHDAGRGFLLRANAGGSFVVLKDLHQLIGAWSASPVDAVETLGKGAGVVVNLQPIVPGRPDLVGRLADLHFVR